MTISTTNPLNTFGFIFFYAAFVYTPVLFEYSHAKAWKPSYFRRGIPRYRKHFHLTKRLKELESFAKPLEEHLLQKYQQPPVVFKPLSSQELAFLQEIVEGEKKDPLIACMV